MEGAMKFEKDVELFVATLNKYTKVDKTRISEFLKNKNVKDIFQNPYALTDDLSKIKRIEELRFLRNTYDNLKDYTRSYTISNPQDAKNYFLNCNMDRQDKEYFSVAFLNTKSAVIDVLTVEGSINSVLIDVREIMKEVLKHNANRIVIAHNHPSGVPEPSNEDIQLTKRICRSCDLLGIDFLDHVITSNEDYVSLRERFGEFDNHFFKCVKENEEIHEENEEYEISL